jgi:(p)ppGpp synthase/HD superfamily hydrolase
MNEFDPEVYARAFDFAARAHQGQLVPGGDVPYISHVAQVAMETMLALWHAQDLDAELAVQCALLHDTVEDTAVTVAELADLFGQRVATGVLALSKDPRLPKDQQMADSLQRIVAHSPEARLVKMADRVNNLREPPHYWSAEKIATYRAEARLILQTLGGVNPYLEQRLARRIEQYATA